MIDNINPYWRDHASCKGKFITDFNNSNFIYIGWTSMNYPTVMQNPLLKRRETKKEKEEQQQRIKFSNMERP